MVTGICAGLSAFAIRDQRAEGRADAAATAAFVADQAIGLVLLDDRVGLQALIVEVLASRKHYVYVFIERDGRPFVHTFQRGVPAALLELHGERPDRSEIKEYRSSAGDHVFDAAAAMGEVEGLVHVGVSRRALDAETAGRIATIWGTGLLALLLGVVIARWIASITTREVDLAQAALRESEQRYRILFEQAPDGIALLDLSNPSSPTLLDCNPTMCRLHGYSREEMIGMEVDRLAPPDGSSALIAGFSRVLAGEVFVLETEHRHTDGSLVDLEVIARRVKLKKRPVIQALFRDVSERKQAEKERAELEVEVERARRLEAIGQLAGGVAHDMNNMLDAILGAAELLESDLAPGDQHLENAENILAACHRGRELTRNLVGYARQGRYVRGRISLNELANEARELLRRKAPKEIRVKTMLAPDLRPIEGYRSQLFQAVTNLCQNALEAMSGEGQLILATRNVEPGELKPSTLVRVRQGPLVLLRVEDSGVGMGEETRQCATEPFFTTKSSEGAGLGLSMVEGTLGRHGGAVEIESEPGKGTNVKLVFPAAEQLPDHQPQSEKQPGAARRLACGVLLAEDEMLVRWSTRRRLERLGCTVFAAENGREAIETYEENAERISLVILDLIMPVMGGAEAFRELRKLEPDLRILVTSGYTRDQQVEELMAAGAVGFLEKPVSTKELAEGLEAALGAANGSGR